MRSLDMARYYLHLRDGADVALDDEGRDFASLDELEAALVTAARDVIAGDVMRGSLNLELRIDAETVSGELVRSLAFQDAVAVEAPRAAA
jgi:hypothetical protein